MKLGKMLYFIFFLIRLTFEFFLKFLKFVKCALFQNTTKQQNISLKEVWV